VSPTDPERRRPERITVALDVDLVAATEDGVAVVPARTIDLGTGGVRLLLSGPTMRLRTQTVTLHVRETGSDLLLTGRVVQPELGAGIVRVVFVGNDEIAETELHGLINAYAR